MPNSNSTYDWNSFFSNGSSLGAFPNNTAMPFLTKSPLTEFQWQHNKRTSKEIQELFFPAAKEQKKNDANLLANISLFKEEDCHSKISLDDIKPLKDVTFYYERNNIEGFQKGEDEYLFTLKVFVSRDKGKLEQAHKESKPQKDEVFFFLEDNTDDWSTQKLYASFGDDTKKNVLRNLAQDSDTMKVMRLVPGLNTDYEGLTHIIRELVDKQDR